MAERYDAKSNVKLIWFRSKFQASYMYSHTEEMWSNETVWLMSLTLLTLLIYIYIYKYVWKYCHLQTDSFFRHSIIPLSQQANHISSGIIRHYVVTFICLHFCLNGYQSAQLIQRALHYASGSHKILSPKCSTSMGDHIYCHPKAYCFVVSQLFSVAIHVRHLKLESKPT